MNRNNGYLQLNFASSYHELVYFDTITPLKRNKTCFYINSLGLFFKEEVNTYLELIGSKIGKLLNINCLNYDMLEFTTKDKNYKGVISNDFREDNYKLITIADILEEYITVNNIEVLFNDMNFDLINKALNYRYSNYDNKDIIVNKIMNDIKKYFLLDLLLGNIDNGKYNYEIMESNNNAKLTPYFDFEEIFKFSSTRFTVSDINNYDIYDNLYEFLNKNNEYIQVFSEMYNMLTPEKLESIMHEVEMDINYKINGNNKNIIFLSYYRHYQKIGEVLNRLSKNNIIKK